MRLDHACALCLPFEKQLKSNKKQASKKQEYKRVKKTSIMQRIKKNKNKRVRTRTYSNDGDEAKKPVLGFQIVFSSVVFREICIAPWHTDTRASYIHNLSA